MDFDMSKISIFGNAVYAIVIIVTKICRKKHINNDNCFHENSSIILSGLFFGTVQD